EADIKAKQDREAAVTAARVAAVTAATAATAAAAEKATAVAAEDDSQRAAKGPSGTLHRPAKTEDRPAAKDARRGARAAPVDEGPKRRGLKTRGDVAGPSGNWRGARGGGRSSRG